MQTHAWVVPTVQSIHVLGIATVAASALMINLRLLGLYAAGPAAEGPGDLVRAGGWHRDAVKPGEKVEVVFSPLARPSARAER